MLRCAYRSFPLLITLIVRSFDRSIDRSFATSSLFSSLLFSIVDIIFFSLFFPFALEPNICLYLLSEDDEDKPAAFDEGKDLSFDTITNLVDCRSREENMCFSVFFYRIASNLFRSLDSRD